MKKIILVNDFSCMSFLKNQYPHYQQLMLFKDNIKEVNQEVVSIDFFENQTAYFILDQDGLLAKYNEQIKQLLTLLNEEVYIFTTSSVHNKYEEDYPNLEIIEPNFDIKAIINSYIKANQINIEKDALELLLFNLDENYLLVKNELDKLSLIDKPITMLRIENESYKTTTANTYSLVDYILLENKEQIKLISTDLLESEFSEMSLLIFVYRQVSLYLLFKLLLKHYNYNTIKTTLKLSDYRFKQMQRLANQVSEYQLYRLIKKLHNEEIKLKYS